MMATRWRFWSLVVALAWVWMAPQPTLAGPPPDPRQMSGIPLPSKDLSPATVMVRCLLGSLAEPAIGVDVQLKLTSADGTKTETRTAKSADLGRATFSGLDAFIGGSAVASATLDGAIVGSGRLPVRADSGTKVLLVAGAGAPVAASGGQAPATAHSRQGPSALPDPGAAFPMKQLPAGELRVGTFDLTREEGSERSLGPVPGIEIKLTITPPGGDPSVRTKTTDKNGRVSFLGLVPPSVPEGSKLQLEGVLKPGAEPQRSQLFEMRADVGMAVFLAELPPGGMEAVRQAESAGGQGASARAAPRVAKRPMIRRDLPAGTVTVRVVNGAGDPVADQTVVLVKKSSVGGSETWQQVTDKVGNAIFADQKVQADAFFFVEANYDGGPYQTPFFGLDKRGGIEANLVVYPTTADPAVVRSALQWNFASLEDDHVQVAQLYEVMVQGDKAYWPEGGLRLDALPGAKGLEVLRTSEAWLNHEEKAPFVDLAGPVPPGQPVKLYFAYIVEHDGSLDVSWTPPFSVVGTGVHIASEMTVSGTGLKKSDKPSPIPDRIEWQLEATPMGKPVEFTVSGLPIVEKLYRNLGYGIGGVLVLFTLVQVFAARRMTTSDRLQARRDQLLKLMRKLKDEDRVGTPQWKRAVAMLDRIHRQLRAIEEVEASAKSETKAAS